MKSPETPIKNQSYNEQISSKEENYDAIEDTPAIEVNLNPQQKREKVSHEFKVLGGNDFEQKPKVTYLCHVFGFLVLVHVKIY